jgi:hypothetical protein
MCCYSLPSRTLSSKHISSYFFQLPIFIFERRSKMNTLSESSTQDHNRKTNIILIITGLIAIALAFIIGTTDNPPGILLLLFGLFTLVFAFLRTTGKTQKLGSTLRLLYWAPRTLGIVFAVLISLFALDVFSESRGFWATSLALLLHLIPTFVLIGLLVLSWRREWIAGILFTALGVLYIFFAWNRFPLATCLLIAGPLVLTGLLFLLNWRYRKEIRAGSQT